MTGCWDLELEPSIEEIVDSLSLLSLVIELTLWGDFLIQSSTWPWRSRARPGQLAQTAHPNICAYTEHVQFVDVS